ncbi:MAG: 16S rRNA (uracil(1498)-N(3))-methyltransferase [Candidatus Omnitrophica bacterium]|nr:16S rRNA (uracil(1498)-N(3))-methyltransferase [Candidatus Omnitrophota bacterium]
MEKALKRFLISFPLGPRNLERNKKAGTVLLTKEETHHLKNVLHMKEGSLCVLFDREGNEFVSRIERFGPGAQLEARLLEPVARETSDLLRLTVAQAIPQDRNMDRIVEKAAELGLFELMPLVTERTVVRMEKEQFDKVHRRWERIAEQTLKQCRLRKAPKIAPLTLFKDLSSEPSQYDLFFLLHPSKEASPIRDCVSFSPSSFIRDKTVRVLLAIGPEGGFSPREVAMARARGARLIQLGQGILKTDTAFVAAAGFFRFGYG